MQPTISNILDALDLDALGKKLNVKPRSFRLCKERNVFPAAWFPAVKSAAAAAGIECPMCLFNWRTPSDDCSTDGLACFNHVDTDAGSFKGAAE